MGIVSGAVLDAGGDVVGVIPREMRSRWGEEEKVTGDGSTLFVELEEAGREMVRLSFFPDRLLTESIPRWNWYGRLYANIRSRCSL